MAKKTLAKYISDNLIKAGWPGIVFDEQKQSIDSTAGPILSLKKSQYHLIFYYYSTDKKIYVQREKYHEIVFPKKFDLRKYLFFKRNGTFKISREQQLKSILNPFNKGVKTVKIGSSSKLSFYKDTFLIPTNVFIQAMADSDYVYQKSSSYRNSAENYLCNLKSHDYCKNTKKRTTFIEPGEFNFLVDRLYLKTKTSKNDFSRYLNTDDFRSIEELLTELLRLDVLSDDFLKRLNDYFIRERLKDIINQGKEILSLRTTDLKTLAAQQVLTKMNLVGIDQLETLWQKYFEKNLLYLIFTYKKIFPKVELRDIEGEKKCPDFIGINHYNGLDVIEIKTHLKSALVWDNSHQNFYFSPEMSKAIVQTTNYMDAIMQERFKNPEDREKITKFVDEENLYHPRGIIIISSTNKLTSKIGEDEKLKRDFTKLRNSVHNIEILTFDEILNIADEYIKNIISEVENGQ